MKTKYVILFDFETIENATNNGRAFSALIDAEQKVKSFEGLKDVAGKPFHYEIVKIEVKTIRCGTTKENINN